MVPRLVLSHFRLEAIGACQAMHVWISGLKSWRTADKRTDYRIIKPKKKAPAQVRESFLMAISPIPIDCLIRSITRVHAHTRFWICVDFALELCPGKAIALQVDDEQHDRYELDQRMMFQCLTALSDFVITIVVDRTVTHLRHNRSKDFFGLLCLFLRWWGFLN